MDRKWYESHTEKILKGKKCKSLFPLKNGWCTLPAGTIYTITRKYQGFNLTSEKCPHCGAQQHISRVSFRDIQMLPIQPFDINSDSPIERGPKMTMPTREELEKASKLFKELNVGSDYIPDLVPLPALAEAVLGAEWPEKITEDEAEYLYVNGHNVAIEKCLAAHIRAMVERRSVAELPKNVEHSKECLINIGCFCSCGTEFWNDQNAKWRRALNLKEG